ncbi:MAG: hypothetical protein ACLGHO_05005 [Gammaproteobacteria bacterium]
MPKTENPGEINWSLATWDGSRREALRRWAQLPLERVIAALEEMQELSDMLAKPRSVEAAVPSVHEQHGNYNAAAGTRPACAPTGRQSNKSGDREE